MKALKFILHEATETPPQLVAFAKTPAFAAQARAAIAKLHNVKLPAEFDPWVARYGQVGKRNAFLWTWLLHGLDITTLSSVDGGLRRQVLVVKLLSVMLDVLLDDIADVRQDSQMLEEALDIVSGHGVAKNWSHFDPDVVPYFQCIDDIWSEITLRIRALPRFSELFDLLAYDYDQLFNTMRYSVLINRRSELLNLVENELYQSHNMLMMVSSTIDLMASPSFELGELGLLREVLFRSQRMGRIGNEISTWERELKDADYSSAVFGYALREGFIDYGQIRRGDKDAIRQALIENDVESYFLREWQRLYDEMLTFTERIVSVDIRLLATGHDELIRMHLASKGLI